MPLYPASLQVQIPSSSSSSSPSVQQVSKFFSVREPRFNTHMAVRLVAGFPPRRPRFHPRSGHVGFVVDKVTLGLVFPEYFGFSYQFSFH
jgi:hypothetical protein